MKDTKKKIFNNVKKKKLTDCTRARPVLVKNMVILAS